MPFTDTLIHLAQPWADLYSDSKLLQTGVTFAHIGALLLGGGVAVAADRSTLRAGRGESGARAAHLAELHAIHRLVVSALVISLISGVLLFLADVKTFLPSWVFWLKLALVALLLVNGYLMTRTEGSLATETEITGVHWTRLTRNARISIVLWFATTLVGVALVNVS